MKKEENPMQEFAVCITGFIFMLCGIIMWFESDQPNGKLGYRLLTVKKTLPAWQLSNKFAAKLCLIFGAISLVIGIYINSYVRLLTVKELVIFNVIELVIMALLTIVLTEIRTHLVFDKEGNRK